jgi:hypothetical protein
MITRTGNNTRSQASRLSLTRSLHHKLPKPFLTTYTDYMGLRDPLLRTEKKSSEVNFGENSSKCWVLHLNDLPRTTDGQTEGVNQCLENPLRCMSFYAPKKRMKRVQCLSLAEYWYNTSYHTSMKCTPFEALYGYSPPHMEDGSPPSTSLEPIDKRERCAMIHKLKSQLIEIKYFADRKRTEREGEVVLQLTSYLHSSIQVVGKRLPPSGTSNICLYTLFPASIQLQGFSIWCIYGFCVCTRLGKHFSLRLTSMNEFLEENGPCFVTNILWQVSFLP